MVGATADLSDLFVFQLTTDKHYQSTKDKGNSVSQQRDHSPGSSSCFFCDKYPNAGVTWDSLRDMNEAVGLLKVLAIRLVPQLGVME